MTSRRTQHPPEEMTRGYCPWSIDRLSTWSPGGNAVLMYHSVGERYPEGTILPTADFRDHLAYLDEGYDIVDLPAVFETGEDPRVALTFDAAYKNFYTEALPVLREFDAPFTQFVIPDRIGRENDKTADTTIWNEWFDFMDAGQLRDLVDDALATLGNKSLTHRSILPPIRDEETLRREVVGGKEALEDRFGITVDRYCYGSGRFDPESVAVVRECHDYAVTTQHRYVSSETDPLLIPRFDVDFIDRATLDRRLSTRFAARRHLRRMLKRGLGSWYPRTDALVRYSFADHVSVADRQDFPDWVRARFY